MIAHVYDFVHAKVFNPAATIPIVIADGELSMRQDYQYEMK